MLGLLPLQHLLPDGLGGDAGERKCFPDSRDSSVKDVNNSAYLTEHLTCSMCCTDNAAIIITTTTTTINIITITITITITIISSITIIITITTITITISSIT
ncbi:hypothetical protein J1605_011573 [Eschrichtius robustus]|uniref:Uncharacterized protein n=1 Tax=Eschrichtius robustus TaxID=9764 RepID=A0AB34GLM2_ESCRO|nr:hypothetical protein J1605_011573 [Eschrichtius robustus]